MAANPNSKRAGKDAGISTFKFIPVIPGKGKKEPDVIEFVGYNFLIWAELIRK